MESRATINRVRKDVFMAGSAMGLGERGKVGKCGVWARMRLFKIITQ